MEDENYVCPSNVSPQTVDNAREHAHKVTTLEKIRKLLLRVTRDEIPAAQHASYRHMILKKRYSKRVLRRKRLRQIARITLWSRGSAKLRRSSLLTPRTTLKPPATGWLNPTSVSRRYLIVYCISSELDIGCWATAEIIIFISIVSLDFMSFIA